MVPADGAERVSRAETSRHKERASLLTKAGGDTLCRGWAHNSPLSVGLELAQLEYLGCHPAMPPASAQLHPPTRRAFLHLHTNPDCSDASPAAALFFCPSQRWFWEEMEDLQHLHDQSCWDYKVSKGTEASHVSPDQVVLVPSAAPFQDISVPSAAVLCGCASPQPTLSQFPHQWLRSCFTFAGVLSTHRRAGYVPLRHGHVGRIRRRSQQRQATLSCRKEELFGRLE